MASSEGGMKKRVAILIPNLRNGGAERVASNLSYTLAKDYEVYMVVYDGSNPDYHHGGSLINLHSEPTANPVKKLWKLLDRVRRLKQIKKTHQIHATISFMEGPNVVNILSRADDRIIVSVRIFKTLSVGGFYVSLQKQLMKKWYNRADLVVAVSEIIKKDLIENFAIRAEKVRSIYNAYDVSAIQKLGSMPLESEYEDIFLHPVLINAGRLTTQKAQWHLIRAFKRVKEEVKDAQLVILGDGGLNTYLQELAMGLGLEESVHLLGFQRNPFRFLCKASAFVFPSMFEGFPNALCEAMACGLPVIASDCKSGPREILAPTSCLDRVCKEVEIAEFGILVPLCDGTRYEAEDVLTKEEEGLAEAMIDILTNKMLQEKLKEASLVRAKELSVEDIYKEWLAVIENHEGLVYE